MRKKRWGKSFLNLHFKGFGAITRSDSCRVLKTVHFGIGDISKCWMDDYFVKILVFFKIWSTNGSLLGVNQWFLWVNQWFLWVNQWFPCWRAPMAPLLGRTKTIFLRLEACRRRFFIIKNDHFGVAGAARREHNSSFPKNSSISPIETNFAKACCATGFAFYDGYKIDTAILCSKMTILGWQARHAASITRHSRKTVAFPL